MSSAEDSNARHSSYSFKSAEDCSASFSICAVQSAIFAFILFLSPSAVSWR